MKWKGTFSADVIGFRIKRNGAHDGKDAELDLEIGVKEDGAESKFGEDFVALAFATKRVIKAYPSDKEAVDAIGFLADKIRPGHRVVFERHNVEVDGHDIIGQPELLSIETVDGEARVIARVRLQVDVSKKSAVNALVQLVGETVTTKWNPQQGTFDFESRGNSRGNGHNLGKSEDADDRIPAAGMDA